MMSETCRYRPDAQLKIWFVAEAGHRYLVSVQTNANFRWIPEVIDQTSKKQVGF